jgi:hypothetical protein
VLIEKLWYLKDQEAAGTTSKAAHQIGATAPTKGQKDHPHQGVILTRILTGRRKINPILVANAVVTGAHHLQAAANHIQANRHLGTTARRGKVFQETMTAAKNAHILHNVAGQTPVARLMVKANQKEILNHAKTAVVIAGQNAISHPAMTTAQNANINHAKTAVATVAQNAISNHGRIVAANASLVIRARLTRVHHVLRKATANSPANVATIVSNQELRTGKNLCTMSLKTDHLHL